MAYVYSPSELRTAVRMVLASVAVILATFLIAQPRLQPPPGASPPDAMGGIEFRATTTPFGYGEVTVNGETYYPVGAINGREPGRPNLARCTSDRVLISKMWLLNPVDHAADTHPGRLPSPAVRLRPPSRTHPARTHPDPGLLS